MSCINCCSSNCPLFVKGFVQNGSYDVVSNPSECTGEFLAIITDLVTSSFIPVKSAIKDGNSWILEYTDSQIHTFAQEPVLPKYLISCRLIRDRLQETPKSTLDNVVFHFNYPKAILEIKNGANNYYLIGYSYNTHTEVKTEPLKEMWQDSSGLYHAITISGEHFTF